MKSRLLGLLFAALIAGGCGGQTYSSLDVEEGNAQRPSGVAEPVVASSAKPAAPLESKHQSVGENPLVMPAGKEPETEARVELPLKAEPALPSPRIASAMPPKSDMPPEKNAALPDGGERSIAAAPSWPPAARPLREAVLATIGDVRPEIQVVATTEGGPVLQIRYPWQKLPRPSIQITRADGSEEPTQPVTLDGGSAVEVSREQVERLNKPTYPSSTELVKTSITFLDRGRGDLITLRGRENLLGKTAVYAVDEKTGVPVVCYLLERWADENGVLHFGLRDFDLTSQFSKAAKVRIWLLSEEQIVWEETVDWPGENAPSLVIQQNDDVPPVAAPADSVPLDTAPDPAMAKTLASPALPEVSDGDAQPKVAAPAPSTSSPDADLAESIPPPQPSQAVEPSPGWKPMETKPSSSLPAAPPGKPTLEEMSIDQLARHIEDEFGSRMSPEVRRFWLNGYRYYYVVPNPPEVKRTILMDMLRSAYAEKPPAELAAALKELFQKLKAK